MTIHGHPNQHDYDELFEKLMKEHAESLARLAFTYVKDRGKAEDVVQDVFLKAFRSYNHFRGDSDIKTWLYRITINRCKDELRSWSFRNIFISNTDIEKDTERGPQTTPELKVISKYDKERLGKAILSLPVKFREVIILFYYQDLSIGEISELLKISTGTVKTRLFRARKKLAQLIPDLEMEGE